MKTADRLLFALLLLVGVIILLKREDPAQALPLVKADYQRCVTFHTDLEHKPAHNYDYRVGARHVDGGIV